jgi:enoyl-CoA hydratase/carnithine racemase
VSEIQTALTETGVARILINRPEVANAVGPPTMEALCKAIDEAVANPEARAIVIGGVGRNFAAGADFGFLEDLLVAQTGGVNDSLYAWFKGTTERLWKSPKPTVAAVGGAAITVGCEITLACDARVASKRSRFGENWLQIGLIPPLGGAVLLPRIVGLTHAKRMILEAQIIGGEEALRIGLVDELVEDDAILARAEERALAMAALPPRAFAAAKAAIHRGFESTMEQEWTTNVLSQAVLIGGDDFREQVKIRLEAKRG